MDNQPWRCVRMDGTSTYTHDRFLCTLRKPRNTSSTTVCLTFVKTRYDYLGCLKVDQILNKSEWWIWHTLWHTEIRTVRKKTSLSTRNVEGGNFSWLKKMGKMRTWSQCNSHHLGRRWRLEWTAEDTDTASRGLLWRLTTNRKLCYFSLVANRCTRFYAPFFFCYSCFLFCIKKKL